MSNLTVTTKTESFKLPNLDDPQDVVMHSVTIRGHRYAAGLGPPWTIPGDPDAVPVNWFVVTHDNEAHANSRGRCRNWLVEKDLSTTEADLLLAFVEASIPAKPAVPPLLVQESKGVYQETIGKLVDQIEDAAKRGDLAGNEIVPELRRTARLLPYARDFAQCLVAMLWTKNLGEAEWAEIRHIATEIVMRDVVKVYIERCGPQLDEDVPKPPRTLDPFTVVMEVRGGVVQAAYSDLPLKMVLVDWDNIKEGDSAVIYPYGLLGAMDDETREKVDDALEE